ncbi:MAG: hypothetical protein EAZ85_11640 [Bacteroidetes bacterium]|nr:MAG: hypothetical protein EAZ85_11640 [Bacteroidota bacterium]TAG89245.1 MAG: hypothetical protein EAZ20_06930 [Bacteroidota bacterium]
MLNLLNKAKNIEMFLAEYKNNQLIIDFKIFVRLSVIIEVYIITNEKTLLEEQLHNEFFEYKIRFLFYTELEKEDSIAISHIFETNEVINYGLKYRFHSLLHAQQSSLIENIKKLKDNNLIPTLITFYSYKGGMGRTTTMTSYALHLAQHKGKKVVVMDFDLEAPGYLNFFNLSNNKELLNGQKNGIIEYLLDAQFIKNIDNIDLKNYYVQLERQHSGEEGKITIFPAGNLLGKENREDYLEALARLDFASEERLISNFQNLFIKIKQELNPDIILIDSRTGFNDVYGMLALTMSDGIVGFFGSSEQTKPGLEFLLDKIKQYNSSTELLLVNSILPDNQNEMNESYERFKTYIQFDLGQLVNILPLNRKNELEKIGLIHKSDINNQIIQTFEENDIVSLVRQKKVADLENIFSTINDFVSVKKIFPVEKEGKLENADLRQKILENLQLSLPKNFAEEENIINNNKFFYRKSMEQIFNKSHFIIQGFKGTGKTYLYKTLKDSSLNDIQNELKRRAGKGNETFVFIDVISEKGKDERKLYDFNSLLVSEIKDKSYYFKYFWIVYTWNAVMLDRHKIEYETTVSQNLQLKIVDIKPDIETSQRFDKIIKNFDELIEIEKDLINLNEFLEKKNINLVILYDQLDNLIKPEYWAVTASPLVEYWWNKLASTKRLHPKIFIRTDLFNKTTGTNTERLKNNMISLEWNKDEVYAYFFKIIFSNDSSKKYFFQLIDANKKTNEFTEIKEFIYEPSNQNQIQESELYLKPLMSVFFGEKVESSKSEGLGHSYDWFYTNLANADRKSISLRPFINLIKGAVEYAIKSTTPNLPIIHSNYYANFENRTDVAEKHFRDLVREDFNKDLEKVFDYLRQKGDSYKYIYLTKSELQDFLELVLKEYHNNLESKNVIELTQLLEANGIINFVHRSFADVYYFPQLYKYWLGLRNRNGAFVTNLHLNKGDIVDCVITQILPNKIFVNIEKYNQKASIHVSKISIPSKKSIEKINLTEMNFTIGQKLKAYFFDQNDFGINLSLDLLKV